jgi:hypothetical protein
MITKWVTDGAGLSEVQKRISSEFGAPMTYMDVRFLVLELGAAVKDKVVIEPKKPEPANATDAEADLPAGNELDDGPDGLIRNVAVSVDRIMKPGSMISGTVTFSDGVNATWSLDQTGRLALSGPKPGYTPGEDDIVAFQQQLRKALEKLGYA